MMMMKMMYVTSLGLRKLNLIAILLMVSLSIDIFHSFFPIRNEERTNGTWGRGLSNQPFIKQFANMLSFIFDFGFFGLVL